MAHGTGCSGVVSEEAGSVTLRRHSAAVEVALAAEAVLSLLAPAKCYWGWPVGLRAGITARCWTGILTVRFPVQVKSFFPLILLFVPSGLPLLLLLHTSNGFSLDPANNKPAVKSHVKGQVIPVPSQD